MDQGSPGLPANRIGIEAEKAALDRGVGATYPAAAGIQELKDAASRFVKAFINTDISPRACIPTTGSVALVFCLFHRLYSTRSAKRYRFIYRPGFPIQKSQLRILGVKWEQFDIYISEETTCGTNWSRFSKKAISQPLFIPIPIIRHGSVWKKAN